MSLEHSTQQWTERTEATYIKVSFSMPHHYEYQESTWMPDTPTAVHNSEPSLRPRFWRQAGLSHALKAGHLFPSEVPLEKCPLAYLVAQMAKDLPAMQKSQVWTLDREDPLEKGMATHSSILAWEIPWTEKPCGLHSMGLQRVGHDSLTNTFTVIQTTTKPKCNSS